MPVAFWSELIVRNTNAQFWITELRDDPNLPGTKSLKRACLYHGSAEQNLLYLQVVYTDSGLL